MELQLKFNSKEWISILSKLYLSDTDPEDKRHGGFLEHEKPGVIAHNADKKVFRDFLDELKQKRQYNKDNGIDDSESILIDCPETKSTLTVSAIRTIVEKFENKELYYALLKNNNQPNYQVLVRRMSDDHRGDNVCIKLDFNKKEDSLLHIFKSAIAMCPPVSVQSEFEYFTEQWSQLDVIDSKQEAEEKRIEILQDFHKAMRQTDMFGNGHACSIIYELWRMSNIVYKAFIAVINHVKEEEEFKK